MSHRQLFRKNVDEGTVTCLCFFTFVYSRGPPGGLFMNHRVHELFVSGSSIRAYGDSEQTTASRPVTSNYGHARVKHRRSSSGKPWFASRSCRYWQVRRSPRAGRAATGGLTEPPAAAWPRARRPAAPICVAGGSHQSQPCRRHASHCCLLSAPQRHRPRLPVAPLRASPNGTTPTPTCTPTPSC